MSRVNAGNTIDSSDVMLMDEETKAQYYLQSRDALGVIGQLVKILNDFTMNYDKEKKKMIASKKNLDATFVRTSAHWDKGYSELTATFNSSVEQFRQDALAQVNAIIADARTQVKTIMIKPVTEELMNTINMIGDAIPVDGMTKFEMMTLIESCKGNYLATKAMMKKMNAPERLNIPFVSADDMMESIDDIYTRATSIVRNYHGDVGYEFAIALQGDYFRHISDAYDKFMELYK